MDEAHCVYKWGAKFHPSYARIHELRSVLPANTPMLATTATVTQTMLQDITRSLNMIEYQLVYVTPERSNIFYRVKNRTLLKMI